MVGCCRVRKRKSEFFCFLVFVLPVCISAMGKKHEVPEGAITSPSKKSKTLKPPKKSSPTKQKKERSETPGSETPKGQTETPSDIEKVIKTPRREAGKLGIKGGTGKTLLSNATRLKPFYQMLWLLAQVAMEQKPATESEFRPFLDEFALLLVNTL
jgi:hypothetical protein